MVKDPPAKIEKRRNTPKKTLKKKPIVKKKVPKTSVPIIRFKENVDVRTINGNKILYPINRTQVLAEVKTKTASKEDQIKRNQENVRKLAEYRKANLITFYKPNNSFDIAELSDLGKEIKPVDVAFEKTSLFDRNDPTYAEFFKKHPNERSTFGNRLQTQVFPVNKNYPDNHEWLGIFSQESAYDATKTNPKDFLAPTLSKPKVIFVDDDNIGHLTAYQLNMFGNNEPFKENVYFGVDGLNVQDKAKSVDNLKVQKALGKSILDTLATRQNRVVNAVVNAELGKGALKYIDPTGKPADVTVSVQIVEISSKIHEEMDKTTLEAHVADRVDPIIFSYDTESFEEKTPKITFVDDPDTKKRIRRLDTDMLLRASVKKFGIEPDSAQKIMESLNTQGWISYPRVAAKGIEEIETPIELKRDIEPDSEGKGGFRGSAIERNILQLVKDSEIAFNKEPKENFIRTGKWVLTAGELTISEDDTIFAGESDEYTHDQFDLRIGKKRGISPEKITIFLEKKKIGTPATRTSQLARLKNSGIVSLRHDHYVLDNRGLYIVAMGKSLKKNKVPDTIDLQKKIREAKNTDEIAEIVNTYHIMNKEIIKPEVIKEADKLIDAEHDLAFLETF